MMISFIPIYKRDFLEIKIEIYYKIMGVVIKDIFKSLLLCIVVWFETVLEKVVVENVMMICVDGRV